VSVLSLLLPRGHGSGPRIRGDNGHRKIYTARAELVLIHDDLEPLGQIPFRPNPLFRFARINTGIDVAAGESTTIIIDLLPLTPRQRRRFRRKVGKKGRRKLHRDEGGAFADTKDMMGFRHASDVLFGEGKGGSNGVGATPRRAAELDQEQHRAEDALRQRLGSFTTGFRLQVLIQAKSPDWERARTYRDTLAHNFNLFGGANSFQIYGFNLGFTFLGSDNPLLRWYFDHRMRHGVFRPAKRNVVAADEIHHFLRPPHSGSEPDTWVLRLAGAQVPPEFQMPPFDYQPDLVPLGRVMSRQGVKLLATRVSDFRLSYLGGKSKSGKTEQAMNQFIHLARSGYGCFFIDPHPHNIDKLRPYLTDVADRIVEINFSDSGVGRDLGWNLLDMQGRSFEDIELKSKTIVDSFFSVLHLGLFELGERTRAYLTMAVQAVLELAMQLPAELAPTLFQVGTLLSDEGWRRATLPYLSPTVRAFWERPFAGGTTEEAIAPIVHLLTRFFNWTNAAVLMGASRSTYDIRRFMDEGKIVLACSGGLGEREQLAANFMVYELMYTGMLARQRLAPEQRRPFHAFIEEIEAYDRAGTAYGGKGIGYLADLLERLPRYNVFLHMLNESPERLTPKTWEAILTARTVFGTMALDLPGAEMIAKEWSTTVQPLDITLLDRYHFLLATVANNIVSLPIQNHAVSVREMWAHCRNAAGVPAMNEQIDENIRALGQKAQRSVRELNTLDNRIRKWLDDHRREVAPPERSARQAPSMPVPQLGWRPEPEPARPQLELVGGGDQGQEGAAVVPKRTGRTAQDSQSS
jgi:hypothetical protein